MSKVDKKILKDAKKDARKEQDRRKLKRLLDPDSKCRSCAYSITTTCRHNYNPIKCGKAFKDTRDLKPAKDNILNDYEEYLKEQSMKNKTEEKGKITKKILDFFNNLW